MALKNEIERHIFAAAYAHRVLTLYDRGCTESFRYAHADIGIRIQKWEEWCGNSALDDAEFAVEAYRRARKNMGRQR